MSAAAPPSAAEPEACQWGCDETVLCLVFCLLDPKSLVQARAVNRAWRDAASDPQIRRAAFINCWQLLGCHGAPRQPQFYETAALASFVREHRVARSDTLQMLAVRHGVTVPCLKRVNNLMSDHSMHSRTHLYIPVACQGALAGALVRFHHDTTVKRDFAVLLSGQRGDAAGSKDLQQQLDALEKQQQRQQHGAQSPAGSSLRADDAQQARLCKMLGRLFGQDEAAARFYLEDANGDMKAAMEAFAQDVAWDATTSGPIRTVPVQRWISGELGM